MLVAAPASNQGKTTVTAALARLHRKRGRRVRVFKAGPDFLDAMILEEASGQPVYQLDLWMGGEDHCRALLHAAAREADLILVEGVMGLFDGQPSSADLAALFGLPVLAVIDATAMAQTFGAIAYGLARYRKDIQHFGVIANRVASARHGEMLAESLPPGQRLLAALPRREAGALPRRHLGLVQAQEIEQLSIRLDHWAEQLAAAGGDALPGPVAFPPASEPGVPPSLQGMTLAVARDRAFSFIYRANLDVLTALGAELRYFSPLAGEGLPDCDAVYLPGGYPELHLPTLADNIPLKQDLAQHCTAGKVLLAECGGMLYLLESLTGLDGQRAPMAALLPGHAVMQDKLANLGLHRVTLPGGTLKGHTFHHSHMETPLTPIVFTEPARNRGRPEPVYRLGRLHASYLHHYFPANPEAASRLFAA
ncbi:MAG TPA: cobyrinate a,c-diamide synthase [Gammaproteobacteria bacterium]|nr:cobyrinate a,c-diamide synthase [Gammaproteobacteria bacterium]